MRTELSSDFDFTKEVLGLDGSGDGEDALPEATADLPPHTDSDAGVAKSRGRFGAAAAKAVEGVIEQHGSLDEMRQKLGLSRRKVCALLLVDPSAWTRWTRAGADSAPAHVYQMLALFIEKMARENSMVSSAAKAPDRLIETVLKGEHQSQVPQTFLRDETPGTSIADNRAALNIEVSDLASQIEICRQENRQLRTAIEKREVLGLGWKLIVILNMALAAYTFLFSK